MFRQTALHLSCGNNQKEATEYLITEGANVNVRDNNGDSLLHCMSRIGNVGMLELLVKHGASIDLANLKGY